MSMDWGNGIRTGQEVFNSQELDLLKSAAEKSAKLKSAHEKLTELRNDFDNIMEKVQTLTIDSNISNSLRTELMLGIQTARDDSLEKLKEQLVLPPEI